MLNRRTHEINTLNGIIPSCRQIIPQLYELGISSPVWKDLCIRLWQQQSRALAELEGKVRELGGQPDTTSPEAEAPANLRFQDKEMFLRCVNEESHLVHLYAEARKNIVSFDVRMLLHRHHLQAQEALDHLANIYLTYPTPPANSRHSETEVQLPEFSPS